MKLDPTASQDSRPDPYQHLAHVICLEAVDDYIHNRDKDANEYFILSDYFTILSGGADGKAILDRLDAMEEKPKSVKPKYTDRLLQAPKAEPKPDNGPVRKESE